MKYKSPDDSLNIAAFYKVCDYFRLYKLIVDNRNKKTDDITITRKVRIILLLIPPAVGFFHPSNDAITGLETA